MGFFEKNENLRFISDKFYIDYCFWLGNLKENRNFKKNMIFSTYNCT